MKENHEFDWVVDDYGQDTVSSQWVLTEEQKEDGSRILKGCLVAGIFEEKSTKEGTNGPLCSSHVLKMIFVSASIFA